VAGIFDKTQHEKQKISAAPESQRHCAQFGRCQFSIRTNK
jgi:hypothetical protein